ncbi:hypothetical protein NA78x_004772 [Anatilimnocola sp. NA78]|uniref:hypothetical protein n=1 Tax=Anatilimnocola sp. NA78 TaxID=3415683 RepID=UPI003CE54515
MRRRSCWILSACWLGLMSLGAVARSQETPSIRAQLNQAALRVTNGRSSASAFVLAKSNAADAPLMLITSAHVFEKAEGGEMVLTWRKREAEQAFAKLEVPLQIRQGGKPLWTKHAKADVAVLPLSAPAEAVLPRLTVDLLATRDELARVEPGDLVRSFSFPHASLFDPTTAAFPTIRLGCITGNTVVPSAKQSTFLIDMNTFEGDSGGAVLWQPESKEQPAKIIGLIQGQHFVNFKYDFPYQTGEFKKQMGVAIVIPSITIRETIDQLWPELR